MGNVGYIIDTSIFLNILNVPGRNQKRDEIIRQFEYDITQNNTFLLPYATILETGNFIAQLEGNLKYEFAQKFVDAVKQALAGKSPWKPIKFPTQEELDKWLPDFPILAGRGISLADFTMIKEWEAQKSLHKSRSVRIWSLDTHLQGFES